MRTLSRTDGSHGQAELVSFSLDPSVGRADPKPGPFNVENEQPSRIQGDQEKGENEKE